MQLGSAVEGCEASGVSVYLEPSEGHTSFPLFRGSIGTQGGHTGMLVLPGTLSGQLVKGQENLS